MILATSSTGKFLGMFRDKEDAETFALKQKERYFRKVQLSESTDTNHTNWRTNTTMAMLFIGAIVPIRNPYILLGMLALVGAVLLLAPRPMHVGIATHCDDPDTPLWRWLIEGCYLLRGKVRV